MKAHSIKDNGIQNLRSLCLQIHCLMVWQFRPQGLSLLLYRGAMPTAKISNRTMAFTETTKEYYCYVVKQDGGKGINLLHKGKNPALGLHRSL